VVREIVNLGNQDLVVAEYDDGTETIFDRREIVDLGPEGNTNITPVILNRRHLSAALRQRLASLALILAFVIGISLAFHLSWIGLTPATLTMAVAVVAAYAWVMSRILTVKRISGRE
jgi:CHASE2 domain-containing sensor protein